MSISSGRRGVIAWLVLVMLSPAILAAVPLLISLGREWARRIPNDFYIAISAVIPVLLLSLMVEFALLYPRKPSQSVQREATWMAAGFLILAGFGELFVLILVAVSDSTYLTFWLSLGIVASLFLQMGTAYSMRFTDA